MGVGRVVQVRLIKVLAVGVPNQCLSMGIVQKPYLSIPTLGVGFINLVLAGLLIISGSW